MKNKKTLLLLAVVLAFISVLSLSVFAAKADDNASNVPDSVVDDKSNNGGVLDDITGVIPDEAESIVDDAENKIEDGVQDAMPNENGSNIPDNNVNQTEASPDTAEDDKNANRVIGIAIAVIVAIAIIVLIIMFIPKDTSKKNNRR